MRKTGIEVKRVWQPRRTWPVAALIGLVSALVPGPAAADLKLCNATSARIGVALGYQDPKGWTTEGWWNIPSQTCETLLKGTVPSRFVYVYAVDYERGGEWSGTHTMCIADKTFVIRDVGRCDERGHRSAGFSEVDTGQSSDWTIRIADPDEGSAKKP
ncbi:MAG: DUF1036 domain-containing protein [Hyphomicrobiaceae bacterium]